MEVHHYHPETGEYLGTSQAMQDPLQPGKFIYQINTTQAALPDPAPGYARVFTGEDWEQREDHRGEVRYSLNPETLGAQVKVDKIGPVDEVAPETTEKEPPEIPKGKRLLWESINWQFEDLPPPPLPRVVTMRQGRLALLQAGMLASVNIAFHNMHGIEGEAARVEWEYAQEIWRDNPLTGKMAELLGLDEAGLDDLFRAAVAL